MSEEESTSETGDENELPNKPSIKTGRTGLLTIPANFVVPKVVIPVQSDPKKYEPETNIDRILREYDGSKWIGKEDETPTKK